MRTLYQILTILALISICSANPILTGDLPAEKSWERCLVSISPTHASVSCAVGYQTTGQFTGTFGKKDQFAAFVTVPIFVSKAESEKKNASGRPAPRIEMNGRVYKATNSQEIKFPGAPKEVVRVDYTFHLPLKKGNFSLVVTYQQELTNDAFYYLPLFEGDKTPKNPKNFIFTAFPSDGGELSLDSKNAKVTKTMATRINLTPLNKEMIAIRKK